MKKEDRTFALPIALFYGALFLIYGTHVPFMPVWLDWCGLGAGEISAIMALPLFLRVLVTPAVAVAADRRNAHRTYLIALAWLALASVVALTAARAFWLVLLFAVPLMVCFSSLMPLIETVALQGMRMRGLDYGRMRLWGSLTFVAASFLGGIAITRFGAGAGVWLIVIACGVTVIAAQALPKQEPNLSQAASAVPIWKAVEIRELLARREFQLFLIAAGLVQAAHATFLTFGTLLWQKQGLSPTWSGTLWAIGVAAEVMLFAISGRLVERIGAARLIALGAAVSVVRWIALALEPPIALLVPLQVFHGITYGASHIGAIHFIHVAVPRDQSGSAQALYATVASGIAMGCATLVAGWVYAEAGSLSYLAMAILAAVSLIAAVGLVRRWDGRLLAAQPAA